MGFLTALWIPILVTGVVLFIASSIAWTVLPHHQRDFQKLPNEEEFMSAVRKMNVPPGNYLYPSMTHQEAKDPKCQERYREGPRGKLTTWDLPNMGRNLLLTFVFLLVVAVFIAYIAWESLGPGVGFAKAFQITGAIGVLVFASSGQLNAIWFPRPTLNDFLDGLVFGLLTGLIFAIFWPGA